MKVKSKECGDILMRDMPQNKLYVVTSAAYKGTIVLRWKDIAFAVGEGESNWWSSLGNNSMTVRPLTKNDEVDFSADVD